MGKQFVGTSEIVHKALQLTCISYASGQIKENKYLINRSLSFYNKIRIRLQAYPIENKNRTHHSFTCTVTESSLYGTEITNCLPEQREGWLIF